MTSLRCFVLGACCALRIARAWDYGIMIDAGSGGTRLHIFRWPRRVADPLNPLYPAVSEPQELFSLAVNPGVSSFKDNISGLEPHMAELLQGATSQLEALQESWYLIPIYLKATAGGRDLYQDVRDDIFAKIRAILFACPFRFESRYWARTISGEEEGAHAWLTANLVLGTYRDPSHTFGTLDMGGASTQIAFVPQDTSIIANYFPMRLGNIQLHLYIKSYLQFGYRDANQRTLISMLQHGKASGSASDPLVHPCFPKSVRFQAPLEVPFVMEGGRSVWILGSGDLKQCLEGATRLLALHERCFVPSKSRSFGGISSDGACGIAGTYQPSVDGGQFIAMGQYTKLAKKMGLPLGQYVSLDEFYVGVERLCADSNPTIFEAEVDAPEALQANSTLRFHRYLQDPLLGSSRRLRAEDALHTLVQDPMQLPISRCWKAAWFYLVLRKGMRFEGHTKQIQFAEEINGQPTGWALGAMASEVNDFPSAEAPSHLSQTLLLAVALGFAFGLLTAALLAAVWLRRVTPDQVGYCHLLAA
eukprot:CAMPEP_0115062378 /NCGR_PEP_ID=MMETSP0227-20121206/8510_1 /TAXON_ID=89957 /ORGANISM="Polarella glacialis, Strain CCMP 1383" /LENGTH=531 /DNA_ID=CAMNT_0002447745 /DNA_START=42 /DNA_END=1637 /DNA_ORIENTATION=+